MQAEDRKVAGEGCGDTVVAGQDQVTGGVYRYINIDDSVLAISELYACIHLCDNNQA